jgi:hypothetical protein
MSTVSPNLSLPYIQQNQAQKHVTHNEGMRLLDGVVQLSVAATRVNVGDQTDRGPLGCLAVYQSPIAPLPQWVQTATGPVR